MSNKFLKDLVVSHFEEANDVYTLRQGLIHKRDELIINAFIEAKIDNAAVLEIGGGSGYFLKILHNQLQSPKLFNCELAYHVYNEQVDPDINLIGGNVLSTPFKNDSFDFVLAKNVLHHLVARRRSTSKNLAYSGVEEMIRVVRNGGYIALFEEFHEMGLIGALIFYISLFFSNFSITIDAFGIRPKVVVSFLTPNEIVRTVSENNKVRACKTKIRDLERTKFVNGYKYLPYINRLGTLVFVVQIIK